jgi:hypothetical protein
MTCCRPFCTAARRVGLDNSVSEWERLKITKLGYKSKTNPCSRSSIITLASLARVAGTVDGGHRTVHHIKILALLL